MSVWYPLGGNPDDADYWDVDSFLMEDVFKAQGRQFLLWKTKDGKQIPLSELSEAHLDNIIKMLERKREKIQEEDRDAFDGMVQELKEEQAYRLRH